MAVLRSFHLSPVSLNELGPLSRCVGSLSELNGFDARRQVWKPDIVPVPRCELSLGNASRRTTDRADSYSLPFHSPAAEPDDAYSHDFLLLSVLRVLPLQVLVRGKCNPGGCWILSKKPGEESACLGGIAPVLLAEDCCHYALLLPNKYGIRNIHNHRPEKNQPGIE